jgi:hypothetical protein
MKDFINCTPHQILVIEIKSKADNSGRAWIVFSHSNVVLVSSNPTQGMDVCVCVNSVFVLSSLSVAALRWAGHSTKGSYRLCKKDYDTEEAAKTQQRL